MCVGHVYKDNFILKGMFHNDERYVSLEKMLMAALFSHFISFDKTSVTRRRFVPYFLSLKEKLSSVYSF